MNTILEILTAVVNSLWEVAALAAIVWTALRFWPRTNAATRYAIWWATLAIALILPAAPRWLATMRQHAVSMAVKPVANAAPAAAVPNRVELFVIPAPPPLAARWPLAVLGIWAAILLLRLCQLGRSYVYLRSVKRGATVSVIPMPDIPRRADLLVSRDIVSPMALGFLKPAVVLPEPLIEQLSDAEREHVLLHEAAHLARHDDWANLAARFLAGALALYPVAIWILHRIDREREIACDDWVVARTGAARSYAVSLARLFELRQVCMANS
jgi:beta-lactamase regulating signal transducer with metallopeptidase domain